MSMQANAVKTSVSEKGEKIEAGSRRVRRKSRDLEQDFFGMFLEEAMDVESVFKKYDADGSGTIDQTELKVALQGVKGATPPPDDVVGGSRVSIHARKPRLVCACPRLSCAQVL